MSYFCVRWVKYSFFVAIFVDRVFLEWTDRCKVLFEIIFHIIAAKSSLPSNTHRLLIQDKTPLSFSLFSDLFFSTIHVFSNVPTTHTAADLILDGDPAMIESNETSCLQMYDVVIILLLAY